MKTMLPMLKGYRVLDMTQIVAGPTCTRIMAELGAEVIKIELPPLGDRTRVGGLRSRDPAHQQSSLSTYYFQHNHSKKSLAIDFKHPEGLALIKALVAKSDVLVENFSPGVMARAGLGYEVLKEVNPGLVMCSISMAGQEGPLSHKPGYDYIAQAYSGVTDLVGDPDGAPSFITMAMGDAATGMAAAMAVGFALLHRERTGEGQYLEASLLDTYFQMHEVAIPRVSLRKGYTPKRTGSQHPDGGPTGIFRCGNDGYITLALLPHQWKQFVEALSLPELLTDERFATAALRRDHNDALKDIFESWLAKFPTRDAALAHLEAHRIPCAPVLTLNDAMAHPHLRARGTVRQVTEPTIGSFDIPGLPVKFSRWQPADPAALKASRLGEDNVAVLMDVLGLSETDVRELIEQKILVEEPRHSKN